MGSVAHAEEEKKELAKDVQFLGHLGVFLVDMSNGGVVVQNRSESSLVDIQVEHTIQILEDMFRACVIDFMGNWDDHLPLIEFPNNNNFRSSIHMAPYEALYGRRCRSLVGWFEVGEKALVGLDLVHEVKEKVQLIRDRLKTTYSRPKSYADVRRRDLMFEIDDWVFLVVSPMKEVMIFGKRGKVHGTQFS
ncbi:uncharacterized protein LOC125869724 [Solanum stenotomum]|uniref:uncharacterized protein LOC125869724 n=1 Tax=Solanum stenotomum TaxID=172797 RepID=UPI0020D0A9A3|nr:uncharacterized protein LOC125869724 [Solanum stenotomum]